MLSADPLLLGHVDGGVIAIVLVKTLVTFGVLLVGVLLMVWFERKIVADMQNRFGPNRAGPFGLLQTLADGIKLFFKEDLLPERADRFVFRLAPTIAAVTAFLAFSVVPLGGVINVAGHTTRLQLADPPIGVLFLLAVTSIAVYGVMLAGWSSGSKYPLLGSVRASAQMISYEAAMGLAVATVVLVSGSLVVSEIVESQSQSIFDLNILRTAFIPFFIFLIAGTAELNRPPFDLVEAEQELVGGFQTEYSSIRFALFYLAEFMNTVTMAGVIVTLFLGGPSGPTFGIEGNWAALIGVGWFLAKIMVFLFCYVWLRATLPRMRYDQLMDLGWKKLIPISLIWLLGSAAYRIETTSSADGIAGWLSDHRYFFWTAFACSLAYALLGRAMTVGRQRATPPPQSDPALSEVERSS